MHPTVTERAAERATDHPAPAHLDDGAHHGKGPWFARMATWSATHRRARAQRRSRQGQEQ